MNAELWIPIGSFVAGTTMVVSMVYFKYKTRMATQKTIRLALEKGNELSPDFIKQLGDPEPRKDRDLRRGLIWLAIGVATALFAIILNEPDALGPLLGMSTFPALIGAAFLAMWRFGSRTN